MAVIKIDEAMKILEKTLVNLSQLRDEDQDKLLVLIQAAFIRNSVSADASEGKIPGEVMNIINGITPEWICDAISMDELSKWCEEIRRDIIVALAGISQVNE